MREAQVQVLVSVTRAYDAGRMPFEARKLWNDPSWNTKVVAVNLAGSVRIRRHPEAWHQARRNPITMRHTLKGPRTAGFFLFAAWPMFASWVMPGRRMVCRR